MEKTQKLIREICDEVKEILLAKNRAYGDSALHPIRILSRSNRIEQLNVRIDDKLSRLANGQSYGDEDTELDLIGYLILKRIARRYEENDTDCSVPDHGLCEQQVPRGNDLLVHGPNYEYGCCSLREDGICGYDDRGPCVGEENCITAGPYRIDVLCDTNTGEGHKACDCEGQCDKEEPNVGRDGVVRCVSRFGSDGSGNSPDNV